MRISSRSLLTTSLIVLGLTGLPVPGRAHAAECVRPDETVLDVIRPASDRGLVEIQNQDVGQIDLVLGWLNDGDISDIVLPGAAQRGAAGGSWTDTTFDGPVIICGAPGSRFARQVDKRERPRDSNSDFGLGSAIGLLVGALLTFFGLRHLTSVDRDARETAEADLEHECERHIALRAKVFALAKEAAAEDGETDPVDDTEAA